MRNIADQSVGIGVVYRMVKPKPQILIALAVVVVGAAIWYVNAQREKQRSDLSGFFESQPTDVSSRISGRVTEILVDEGDQVHRGQPLLKLDVSPDLSTARSKQAAASQALEQLQELEIGPRPEDIQKQEAAVVEAKYNLASLSDGPRPQQVAEARAAANAAYAAYQAARRGPTAQEKAESRAKYDSAVAAEALAQKDADRYSKLFALNAVTKQQNDQAVAAYYEATANQRDAEEAWIRSEEGTPADELEEAHQSYLQAKSSLDLVLAGSRIEDIDAAKARLHEAEAALDELLAGSRPEDIAQARYAYLSAEDQVKTLQINLADRVVKSPYDAIIDSVPVSVGDLIASGTSLIRLEDPHNIWIRVYVPEAVLRKVDPGADASLKVDGIDSPLAAYVESVAAHGDFTPANLQSPDERGLQVFEVRLRLRKPNSNVKPGMDATVVRIGTWSP